MVVKHNLLTIMSEQDFEQLEATIPNEELELENNLEDVEDIELAKEEAEKAKQFARQALARAKKAEAELKELKKNEKPAEAPQTTNSNPLTPDEIDARVLRLQGMDTDVLEALKKVAKINGTSLIEAQTDSVFVAMKSKIEAEKVSEQAKLGASKGSGTQRKQKTFNTQGLTDAEHKELWKQAQGK